MRIRRTEAGFTFLEMITVLGICFLLVMVAFPVFLRWIPQYRLKRAAFDLFSNFQLARMRAIKTRGEYAIQFMPQAGRYRLVSAGSNKTFDGAAPGSDDVVERTVSLSEYGSGIRFGFGAADRKATLSGGKPQAGDEISYREDTACFNSKGLSNRMGYVYLENRKGSVYAVSTPTMAGMITMKRWHGKGWE